MNSSFSSATLIINLNLKRGIVIKNTSDLFYFLVKFLFGERF